MANNYCSNDRYYSYRYFASNIRNLLKSQVKSKIVGLSLEADEPKLPRGKKSSNNFEPSSLLLSAKLYSFGIQ